MKDNRIVYAVGNSKHQHMIKECLELDKIVYESKYIGNSEFYTKAFELNPSNFIFAIDANNGMVAGYVLTTPIDNNTYKNMRTGNFIDTELIKTSNLVKLSPLNDKVYIYSLVVSPEYQGMGISKNLIKKLFEYIDNNCLDIKYVLGDTINPKAFGVMQNYGFAPVRVSNHNSVLIEKIYASEPKQMAI